MDPVYWSKLHGASTHFPIALMLASAFCEAVGYLTRDGERQRTFRSASTVMIVIGALASYAAVGSGLVAARWRVWGSGALFWHHLFVWPAFALMTALAAARILRRPDSNPHPSLRLALMFAGGLLMAGAGYWGGEMLTQ